jgi:hypothetical protein
VRIVDAGGYYQPAFSTLAVATPDEHLAMLLANPNGTRGARTTPDVS